MNSLIKFSKRHDQANAAAAAECQEQYLTFTLGGETFAMDIRAIREVIHFSSITEVPLMPPCIRGVINLRGAVVPVIDLGVRLGRERTATGERTCVVILELHREDGSAELGILVDTVSEVLSIGASAIEPVPAFGSDLRSEFLAGVAKVSHRFVLLLDVNHVLELDELAAMVS